MTVARKPLWRWEPFWYLLLFVLLVITNLFQAAQFSIAFVVTGAVLIAVAFAVAATLIVSVVRGPGNPDSLGNLSNTAGLEVIAVGPTDQPWTVVAQSARRQSAIDAAHSFGGDELRAVLVPGATRWLGRRLRVSVQLLADAHIFHAGFLPEESDADWNAKLLPLRRRNRYLCVAAVIRGRSRPYSVELDLGGALAAIDIANAQQASS